MLALAALVFAPVLVSAAHSAFAGQNPVARSTTLKKAKGLQVTNYVLRLPDAYIVYEPSKDAFQIAALGAVLSYGDGWERRQVKPYLFHIRHRAWKNHFWKVNTSRKEVYLSSGAAFSAASGQSPGQRPPGKSRGTVRTSPSTSSAGPGTGFPRGSSSASARPTSSSTPSPATSAWPPPG
jgi:hypothetical protein